MGGSTAVGDGGAAEDWVGSGRIWGRGSVGLLKGAISHSPLSSAPPSPKKCHHASTATISYLPPQESEGAEPEASTPAVGGIKLGPEAPSSAVFQALEVAISAHMATLHLQLGVSRGCTNAGLRGTVRGCQPYVLPSVHMCAETIWRWGLHVPPVLRPLNSDALSHHRKVHSTQKDFYVYCFLYCH